MGICIYKKGTDIQLSKHFKLTEFDCKCNGLCKTTPIHDDLIEKLEMLREKAGNKPLHINSGYRCQKHNNNIGGAKHSYHLSGMAADVRLPKGITVDETDPHWTGNQSNIAFTNTDEEFDEHLTIAKNLTVQGSNITLGNSGSNPTIHFWNGGSGPNTQLYFDNGEGRFYFNAGLKKN